MPTTTNLDYRSYQICTRCVMDTSDTKITFNAAGQCDHCTNYDSQVAPFWTNDNSRKSELEAIFNKIKKEGKGKDFDCIMGMSGGADSSYMLHCAVNDFGLKPLVFHVDGGWNTDIGVNNIEVMVEKLKLDLFTEVINWEEMKAFQLAFFRSGVPHIDIPQDHAFIATLYNFAEKHNIKYILNGGNFSTECVRNPLEFFYYGTDMRHINDIIRQFCDIPLKTYPFSSILRHKLYLKYIKRIQVIKPLNYIQYNKKEAMEFLNHEYGWTSYPQKHFESRFTRFFEGFWLPRKFGFDTRRVQYSSLILTNQMSRQEAVQLLSTPSLSEDEARTEFAYVASKLSISKRELETYFELPNKSYKDYKNQEDLFLIGAKFLNAIGVERSIKR